MNPNEPQDTPKEIQNLQLQMWLARPIEERFALSIAFIEFNWELTRAGIRHQYPHFTEKQVSREILRRQKINDRSLDWLELPIDENEQPETQDALHHIQKLD